MSELRPLSDILGRFKAFKPLRADMTMEEAAQLLRREIAEKKYNCLVAIRPGDEKAFRLVVFGYPYNLDREFDDLVDLVESMRRLLPSKQRWRT